MKKQLILTIILFLISILCFAQYMITDIDLGMTMNNITDIINKNGYRITQFRTDRIVAENLNPADIYSKVILEFVYKNDVSYLAYYSIELNTERYDPKYLTNLQVNHFNSAYGKYYKKDSMGYYWKIDKNKECGVMNIMGNIIIAFIDNSCYK